MKKRYIAAAGLAVLTALYGYGSHLRDQSIASCNTGDYEACQKLAKRYGQDDNVRKQIGPEGFAFWAAVERNEKAAKAKKEAANKFVANTYSVGNLAYDCEKKFIRPYLKDPNSFRKLNHTYKETVDRIYVQVNYTATNGFGGRVQGSKVCNYTL
jgi:hypothetical protein